MDSKLTILISRAGSNPAADVKYDTRVEKGEAKDNEWSTAVDQA